MIIRKMRNVLQELKRYFYLRALLKQKTLSKEKLRCIQFQKFKKLLIHAYNHVPFYRDKYNNAGINPYNLKNFEDIKKIPLTTKEEIRANFPNNTLARGTNIRDCVTEHTSGSTGEPLTFVIDWKNQAIRDAVHEYVRRAAGCESKKILLGIRTSKDGRIIWGANNRYYLSYTADIEKKKEIIDKINPDFIGGGVTSLLYTFLLELKAHKYRFKRRIQGIFITGENTSLAIKEKIKSTVNAPVFEYYGSAEIADIACECSEHNGMHIITPHAYVEILKNNLPAGDLESGEIIITDLDNYAMPFIRYSMGDIGSKTNEPCICGAESPRIISIDGRAEDLLVTKDNKILSHLIFSGDMSPLKKEPLVSLLKKFQIIQKKNKDIVIKLATDEDISRRLKLNLIKYSKNHLGKIGVKVQMVKEIPSEKSGKTKMLRSRISKVKLRRLLG
jgi:phenylacetate-CoA ligase